MGAVGGGDGGRRLIVERFRLRLSERPPILYAILDLGLVSVEAAPSVGRALIDAGIDALQLRGKETSPRVLLQLAGALLAATRARGIPFLLNDRVDVTRAIDADGVHLGQEDLPLVAARRILGPEALLGATAHSLTELDGIEAMGVADYVGYGSIFATDTKLGPPIQGPAALTAARARTRLPLVAIGGMRPERVATLVGTGVAGLAAASALCSAPDIPDQVRAFREALARC